MKSKRQNWKQWTRTRFIEISADAWRRVQPETQTKRQVTAAQSCRHPLRQGGKNMCGITGCIQSTPALPFLLEGLEQMEYRGYDSAGITLMGEGLVTIKEKGRLSSLIEKTAGKILPQTVGIGHTRWATHGIPDVLNAHPHTNAKETISIVHNGIIENHAELRQELEAKGYVFRSQTDSEVIVHLLDSLYQGDFLEALVACARRLVGSFALCAICLDDSDSLYVLKSESPMIVSRTEFGSCCASDIPALAGCCTETLVLEDGQVAVLHRNSIELYDFDGHEGKQNWQPIRCRKEEAAKNGWSTFMEKEMHEQPHALKETLRQLNQSLADVLDPFKGLDLDEVHLIGCGTSLHAAMHGEFLFRQGGFRHVLSQAASEYRYGNQFADGRTLCIFISQSGETADTLAAAKKALASGARTLAVTNVLDSSLARVCGRVLYTCAGPEISVASTKAYTTQLFVLSMAAVYLAKESLDALVPDLKRMDKIVQEALDVCPRLEELGQTLGSRRDVYFLGRGLDAPVVMEGALKMKEVSCIHADAYLAGELKHGPIALIEEGTAVLALAAAGERKKTLSNLAETKARGAFVILAGFEEDGCADAFLPLPKVHPWLAAIPAVVYFQKLALECAKKKGCDPDKPRNLAKSVTVE
jgi:glucosamine--fructose-6-phosphate aminotransferase (isomerizing)